MEIKVNIPSGSSLETIIKKMVDEKNEIHQEISRGNHSIITQKGRKIVRVGL